MNGTKDQEKIRVSVQSRLDDALTEIDTAKRDRMVAFLKKCNYHRFPDLFDSIENKEEPAHETLLPRTNNPDHNEILEKCEKTLEKVDPELRGMFMNIARNQIAMSIAPLSENEKRKLPREKQDLDPVEARQELFKIEQEKNDPEEEDIPTSSRKPFLLSEFSTIKIEPPKWVVEGLFAEGLNLCCSYPKEGKSYLMLNTSFSVLRGLPLCGQFACEKAPVLHFSLEENNSELMERFQRLGVKLDSPEAGFFTMDNGPTTFKDLHSDIKYWLKIQPKTRLIVVDTMGKIQPEGSKNKSDYQNDVDFLGNLQRIAKKNRLGIVLVHHTTKTICPEDPFREIIGSVGTWGTVDMACVLKPNPDEKTWTLFFKGRRGKRQQVALSRRMGQFNGKTEWNGWWDYVGEAEEYLVTNETKEILDILKEHPDGIGPKEISQITGISENNLSKRLFRMKQRGEVKSPSRGKWSAI